MTFRDKVCPPVGHKYGLNKDDCKSRCLKNPRCTAFNFAKAVTESESDCRLKSCPLPIALPTDVNNLGYIGYFQKGQYQ